MRELRNVKQLSRHSFFYHDRLDRTNQKREGEEKVSVVIIGGNECMVCQYEKICKDHGCKAKIFVKGKNGLKKKIGNPDLIVLFTNTVSHSMVISAVNEAKRTNAQIARAHSSSSAALEDVLAAYCG
jgi:hypothetical protein